MPSVIRGSDNFDTAGGNAVKAWVNFNGTGTVAIRASHNVSSITDNGVGDYTVNFATAMPDANYAPLLTTVSLNASNNHDSALLVRGTPAGGATLKTTTQLRLSSGNITAATAGDVAEANVAIFR